MDDGRFRGEAAARAAGIVLLAIPFLPLRRLFGEMRGDGALAGPGEWGLGLLIFVATAWLVTLAAGDRLPSLSRLRRWLDFGGDARWLGGGLAALAGLLVLAGVWAFDHGPYMVDTVAQLFQAEIFAGGSLAAPVPAEPEFFVTQNMILGEGGWYSQYPPGHPGLLAAGVAVAAPWIVPSLLSLGTAVLLFLAARRMWDRATARLTLVLAVLSPFFWAMGATFMNHVSALFFVSLFLYLFVRWDREEGLATALGAGAALGAAALVRPLTAAAVAVAFTAFAVSGGRREVGASGASRVLPPVIAAALGFGAVAGLYLLYNAGTTGNPLLAGYVELWGSSHGLGFHEIPWGGRHTPLDGLRQEMLDLSLLNLYLFEWPVPALLPVGTALALGWATDRWDRRLLFGALALPAAYFFYWHRDAVLGPRFLYAGLAFLLPLTARSILVVGERLRGREWQPGSLFRPVSGGRWSATVLGLCVAYGAVYGAPARLSAYASSNGEMKVDLLREARAAGIEEGLVFVKVSWGNRILGRLRGAGVPAAEAVRAYRGVGHCQLDGLLDRAAADGWSTDRIASRLRRLRSQEDSLVKTAELNGDPTLRVRADRPLPRRCRREVRYDRSGYTLYTPHLLANRPDLGGDFLVARDLRARNQRLRARHPDRPSYLFDGQEFVALEDTAGRGPDDDGGSGASPEGARDGIGRRGTETGSRP